MITRSKNQSTTSRKKKPVSRFIGMVSFAMLVSALGRELRRPAAERTWRGTVWRVVPYDLRFPTWARVRDNFWAPENPQVFPPRVFGVGWSVNFGRVYALMTSATGSDATAR
jgi:hypothetical protein